MNRNILICAVPTFIVLLSVYWFRRKKKFKTISKSEINKQTFFTEECENKLNQPTECSSSDIADTLSDASSFASPESSEKSIRTKAFQLPTPKANTTGNSSITCSTPAALSNCIEVNSFETNPSIKSDNLLYKSKDIPFSDVLNSIEPVVSDSCNKSENKYSIYGDCINTPEITEYEKGSIPNDNNYNPSEITNEILSSEHGTIVEKSEKKNYQSSNIDTSEVIFKMVSYYQNNGCVVENGILPSMDSNVNRLSQHDTEKLQTIETESNDSHSSVLDENSLSYVSDDSECRNQAELKNKDSLSSVLDENSALSSFYEDSEKSLNVESPILSTFKSDIDGDSKDSSAVEEAIIVPVTNANVDLTSIPLKESIHQCENLFDSANVNESEVLDSVENQCSNSSRIADEAQNVETSSLGTKDLLDNSALQNLPIETVEKFSELCASGTNQRHAIALTCCDKALESCDSYTSESNFFPSSNENSPKPSLTVFDTISKDSLDLPSLENPSNSLENIEETNHISVEEDGSHVYSSSATDEHSEIDDSRISPMDISRIFKNPNVLPSESIQTSLDLSNYQTLGDIPSNIFDEKNEIDAAGVMKIPENTPGQYVYEFELPQELCGRLIGKHGKHVKSIKDRSHANVYIKRHLYDPQLKIVVVEGSRSDVSDALEIIRRKYPPTRYPTVTLAKTNAAAPTNVLPDSLQLHIPEGASCDVILSSLVSAGHFFLQQPTHPTYPSLSTLDQCMINCYSQLDTPLLPHPVEPGVICAAPVLRGWYRAQVIYVYENEVDCELKFVDYGGFTQAPTSSLRQIRSDFMSLPFQASECYLANVRPIDPVEGWSAEARSTFEELAQGQILQALLVEYATDGIPCVHLYRVQGITNMFINKELVERGLAVWVNNSHWDPH
ncbi:a-kinase anchor protein 1, mitochondrial [Trichonephila inaurata madagascariensis]|uniref:A-kinase anchor protein 1, mitochondrial n=1 Tax=Trichonephila inaurata madagascariensis TaxID=2747483 RepID=A0A8X6Y8E8_9ARAC|nr:a-kinase anchor protein 1, mitochondrial [Trichonephila inaurata madagascariensis]